MRKRKDLTIYEPERGQVPSREVGRSDVVYGEYLKTLNPREDERVQRALAASPDERFTEFLDRLMAPRYKRVALQTIAKACGISLMQFNQWWQKESTQAAIAIAQTRSIDIAEDMAADARSKNAVCERCDGLKFVAAPDGLPANTAGYEQISGGKDPKWIRTCPVCDGTGKVRKSGDTHARDKIMEMAGIIQKGKGLSISVNTFAGSHASAVEDLEDCMTIDLKPV